MDLALNKKVGLVTGSSRGIGRSIAHALAREGASVVVCARKAEEVAKVERELAEYGREIASVVADLATPEGARAAVEKTLQRFGRIDVLVNNVGGSLGSGGFDRATAEQWTAVVNANLMSAVWCSQHAVAWMKEHGGGTIVHVNSICGREYCTSSPYTAAKAAMTGLTKEMAIDLSKYRIRVNGVAPGSILFEGGSWDRRKREKPEMIEKMLRDDLPWGRFGKPEEVADAVAFLASDRASWITGATLPVDGGQGRAF